MSTGEVPFRSIRDLQIVNVVISGLRPDRRISDNALWELINACWTEEPTQRPTASEVIDILYTLMVNSLLPLKYHCRHSAFQDKVNPSAEAVSLPSVPASEFI